MPDETAVYMEDLKRSTLDPIGVRHVAMRTTGFASMRMTALIGNSKEGQLIRPLIIAEDKIINKEWNLVRFVIMLG